ncbi:low affinity immunoglobulin gamma Fc region receptor II-like isoform X2 [Gymnodraco acuticeps]|uniref:low affinity immunoglobulin gamma Fc region receptor II-like isoform X2 n=1 Tax=Gymnodraco acuticeps TaxID=8218 RepID=UPI00147224FB|nr:low affinity immunoglobulin gamma Fc region receptor II-like isoform X2 [Gymnodraco acuticeps]
MELTTLCTVLATLRVLPNKSQFFKYESVSFSCEGNSSEWKVKRNTSRNTNEECSNYSDRKNPNHCVIGDLYSLDSGVYWCESEAGRCSNSVSITVSVGSVILESPSVPVMEGESVTLSCRNQTSILSGDFYKDGRLIRSSSSGNITIHRVSKSDEGLYKCIISDGGESPDSWLTVRAVRQESPAPPLVLVLLPVCGVCLALGSLMLLGLWRNHKDADAASTYSTVLYSVKMGNYS